MKIFRHKHKSKKQLLTLALMGLMCIGGNAMATQVNVDSATKDMPGKSRKHEAIRVGKDTGHQSDFRCRI